MRIVKYRLSDGTVTSSYAVAQEDPNHETFLEEWVEPETEEAKAKRLARIEKIMAKLEAEKENK